MDACNAISTEHAENVKRANSFLSTEQPALTNLRTAISTRMNTFRDNHLISHLKSGAVLNVDLDTTGTIIIGTVSVTVLTGTSKPQTAMNSKFSLVLMIT